MSQPVLIGHRDLFRVSDKLKIRNCLWYVSVGGNREWNRFLNVYSGYLFRQLFSFFTFEATKSISISLGWTFVVESPCSSRCMNTAYKCSVGRLKSISDAGFYGRRALRDGWHRTQNQGDVRRIFVTFDKQAAATWDVFVHAGRDQWHTTKLSLSGILTHARAPTQTHTHTQACTRILPHTRLSASASVYVCVCVRPIKPHWWKNSRLAVFPDWVALDMHTSKALQVDVPALKCCNSLAWLTQNTFGGAETKSRFYPTLHLNRWWSGEREKKNKKTESYVFHCERYFACVCVCVCVRLPAKRRGPCVRLLLGRACECLSVDTDC